MNITDKQRLVLDAINKHPKAADDDPLLYQTVWEKEGWDYNMSIQYNLNRVTRPETISRRRRELFNLGLIEYSTPALEDRTEAFKNEQDVHSEYAAVSWLHS